MEKKIDISEAKKEHISEIANIVLSNRELYESIMPGAFQKYANSILEQGIPQNYSVEVIKKEKEIIGFIGTKKVKADMTYLIALYLHQCHQNKGIGKEVLREIVATCVAKKDKEIVLLAHENAYWAIRFYERNGFEFISKDEKEIKEYSNQILKDHYIKGSVLYRMKLNEQLPITYNTAL